MRYMKHCHRREWLETIFSEIAADKLPGIVKLLDDRYKHIRTLIGTRGWWASSWHIYMMNGRMNQSTAWHWGRADGELQEEMHNITQHATRDKVVDLLLVAMGKFKDHTLRGKGLLGPDEWKVRYHCVHYS